MTMTHAMKRLLKDKCNIYRKMRTKVGSSFKVVYVRVEEAAPCRLSTVIRASSETTQDSKHQFFTEFNFFFAGGTNLKQDDRLVFEGMLYEVKTHPRNPGNMKHHLEAPVHPLDRGEFQEVKQSDGKTILQVND